MRCQVRSRCHSGCNLVVLLAMLGGKLGRASFQVMVADLALYIPCQLKRQITDARLTTMFNCDLNLGTNNTKYNLVSKQK